MAFTSRTRLVNPRLGSYFGVFTAAFAGLVLMALMFEQLGTTDVLVRLLMYAAPIGFYAAIGLSTPAREARDFFAAGRRVPAFFSGLVLGVTALGGAGFLALTGTLFIVGVDALCLTVGWTAGLVFMGLLFVPFLRKSGAYTLPTFLGRRFASRPVRVVAAVVLGVPIVLLLWAEARFAAYASAWMLGQTEPLMVVIVVGCAAIIVAAGGMRSLTWASVAKSIAALLALAVPATIIAILLSNLPLPQMTHGNMLRVITRMEIARGVPIILAPPFALDLPGTGMEPLVKRFIQSFGSVGSSSFVLLSFVVAFGLAGSPALLSRAGTTPGVYEARKSVGWAVLVTGLVLMTLPAIGVYLRSLVIGQVVGQPGDRLPVWFQALQQAGIAQIESKTHLVTMGSVSVERDATLFALPLAAGFPQVLVLLALAGALAAALAALAAGLVAIASIATEDVLHSETGDSTPDGARVGATRVALLAAAFVTIWLAIAVPLDPLQLFLWSLSISAAASFPILLLAIWWKRANAWGALAAMMAGFVVTVFVIVLSETGVLALPSALAGAIGLPAAFLAGLLTSVITPTPERAALDLVSELRVPGGETVYDRELRLLRLKNRTPS